MLWCFSGHPWRGRSLSGLSFIGPRLPPPLCLRGAGAQGEAGSGSWRLTSRQPPGHADLGRPRLCCTCRRRRSPPHSPRLPLAPPARRAADRRRRRQQGCSVLTLPTSRTGRRRGHRASRLPCRRLTRSPLQSRREVGASERAGGRPPVPQPLHRAGGEGSARARAHNHTHTRLH